METAHVKYLGGLRTEATHVRSGQVIITDAPPDNQGRGEAFSPSDLLATALGSCMMTIMGISARTHGFDIDGTTFKVTKIMVQNPRRVGEVIVEFFFPHNNYSDKEKQFIEFATRNCPVGFSIHPDIKQTVILHF